MLCNFSFDDSKRVAVLAFLLAQPMTVHAQPAVAAASAGPVDTAQTVEEKDASSISANNRQPYIFPSWPAKREVKHERVPPPPPGPYMSSALSGASFSGSASRHDDSSAGSRSAMLPQAQVKPMQKFSPDAPWPNSNMGHSPQRWKPENGYNFVNPAKIMPNPNMPPNYYYGNRYPVMNWPGNAGPGATAPGNNRMPFMGPSVGMSPGRSYPARPGNYAQSVQPQAPYRTPYSSAGRP